MFSQKTEESAAKEEKKVVPPETTEKRPEQQDKKEQEEQEQQTTKSSEPVKKEDVEQPAQEEAKERTEQAKGKPGLFGRLTQKIGKTQISSQKFEELFQGLEIAMLENNVAMEVVEKIKQDLHARVVDKPIKRKEISTITLQSLKQSIQELFIRPQDIIVQAKAKKPFVICFVGVNGSGKTTTIAKVAQKMIDNGLQPVLAAADTFRAAAIEQLKVHGEKLNVKVIAHAYGSDAAAVAFDAVNHAKATNKDVVLIDTAGRLHSNLNLMEEMKKIIRVAKPDLKIFVGESITGNDCIEQAQQFDRAIGIDGIILSKADVDDKGGTAISISYVIKKPIVFIGTGQSYKDLQQFDPKIVLEGLG